MRIRQSGNKIGQNPDTNGRTFWWQCTATGLRPCPTVRLDPLQYSTQVIRPENPDLDGSAKGRREVWTIDNTLVRTHARVRSHLGDSDNEMICPKHLLPMKLLERRRGSGKLLDNYEYVCLAVDADGRACNYSIGLETFPQVAETLRRSEGVGIVGST